VNRHFQAKHVKHQHLHSPIVETTASIPTKFGTVINTTKYSSRVVQTLRTQQIQVGGRPSFWKSKNRNILATVWPINTTFCTMTQT